MKEKNQNPYADVVVDRTPSFLIRHGSVMVILFIVMCIIVGYKVEIQTAHGKAGQSAVPQSEDTVAERAETLSGYVLNTIMSLF